jgi:hypothetical protein
MLVLLWATTLSGTERATSLLETRWATSSARPSEIELVRPSSARASATELATRWSEIESASACCKSKSYLRTFPVTARKIARRC